MVFKCQEDSFLKEFDSNVLACEKATFKLKTADKVETLNGYNVVLEDTILFPEGGGQPCDLGLIGDKRVLNVQRRAAEALHFVETEVEPFIVGQTVHCEIDWERRHDNMQQHSGQHLISAILERDYNLQTLSWWLGADVSYIQLDTQAKITNDQINKVERACNDLIAAATPVTVNVLKSLNDENAPDEVVRATRGLPEDHVGDIRVITIEGVESNMCCGTHVTNLAQLNCVKLLNIEKTKNKLILNFLVGNRVVKRLQESFERELRINNIVNGGPASHADLITKLQANQKSSQRTLQKCLKEIAVIEAERLKSQIPMPKWYSLSRNYGNPPDFINTFIQNAPPINSNGLTVVLLTVGEENSTKGQLMLYGDEKIVQELGPKIGEILDGKCNGHGARFQGKVNNLKRLSECEKLLQEYFDEK